MGIDVMQDESQDNVQFKMRLDEEIDDTVIASQVDELRIEKLNHRMTLITILIPVLIVVILGVAYLDIKRRVIRTEDSGQMTAQTLSEDLQSRFSTLSVGQAMMEENYARLRDQTEKSIAQIQIDLQKLDASLTQSNKKMASRADVKSAAATVEKRVTALSVDIDDLRQNLNDVNSSLLAQISQLDANVAAVAPALDAIDTQLAQLNDTKLDKAAVNLAIKLEILKLKQALAVRIDDAQTSVEALQSELKNVKRRIAELGASVRAQSRRLQQPKLPAPSPGTLQEQPIKQ